MGKICVWALTLVALVFAAPKIKSKSALTNERFVVMPTSNGQYQLVDLEQKPEVLAVTDSDITLYYCTQATQTRPEIIRDLNIQQLVQSTNYDPKKKNVFVVHGWIGDYDDHGPVTIMNALLGSFDVNVFVVDWSPIAGKLYPTAKYYVPQVAQRLANFIRNMYEHLGLTGDDIRLIGHSLGAHLCGFTGKHLDGNVDYVLGLDPAGPLYTNAKPSERLNQSDGKYVQIIHTNGGLLGYDDPMGHADFYPNGGTRQEGCGIDPINACAHRRCYEYFAESVKESNFYALKCESYDRFEAGRCDGNEGAYMGQFDLNYSARGVYYLDTAAEPPFALGK